MNRHATHAVAFLMLVIALLIAAPARPILAAPQAATPPITITSVSGLDTKMNTWTIRLSSGETLRVELRAFDTSGIAPTRGAIANFRDQYWFPIFGYYGYATFTQHNTRYHAKR